MNYTIETPPERGTLTQLEALFGMGRGTLSYRRTTDPLFPPADTHGKFSTYAVCRFLDLIETRRLDPVQFAEQERKRFDEIAKSEFSEETTAMLAAWIADRRRRLAEDPAEVLQEAIADIEAELLEDRLKVLPTSTPGNTTKTEA